jgi:hypothetical protein
MSVVQSEVKISFAREVVSRVLHNARYGIYLQDGESEVPLYFT